MLSPRLVSDLEEELKKTLSEFQTKMTERVPCAARVLIGSRLTGQRRLKKEMMEYVEQAWQSSALCDQETQALIDKLGRFTDQLAMCARRGNNDAAMQL